MVIGHYMAGAFASVPWSGLSSGARCPAAEPSVASRQNSTSLDNPQWHISDGWSNDDRQACAWYRKMVAMNDNLPVLSLSTVYPEGNDRLSTEAQTHAASLQSSFIARMRTESAGGVNANLNTYLGPSRGASHNKGSPEILARDTRQVQPAPDHPDRPTNSRVRCVRDSGESDIEVHTCIATRRPGPVRSYIDGALADDLTGAEVPELARKIHPGHWNTTLGRSCMSEIVDLRRPLAHAVDRVACVPLRAEGQLSEPGPCAQELDE